MPLKLLCDFIGRGRGPTYVAEGGVPVINQRCIRWGQLDKRYLKQTSREAFDKLAPELRLRAGDVLWNSTGTGTIGRALICDGSLGEVTADSHVTIVRSSRIDPAYLGFLIKTSRVQHLVTEGHVGSTNQQELPCSFVEELLVPLAPLPEQRRIVARLDALFAEVANGEAALVAARDGLDTFRRALLKAAVTGDLTADWRAANRVNETGHDLLARIQAERETGPPARGRGRRSDAASAPNTSALPGLPEGWAWATLGALAASVRNGTSMAPQAPANGNEILRISSVRPMAIDQRQLRYLSDEQAAAAKSSDSVVERDDLLFTRYNGSADLVGVGAIYRGGRRFFPDRIIRVRLAPPMLPCLGFVEMAVNAGEGRRHIAANIETTAGQQGLSGESLKGTPVPVPPLSEAAEIVRRFHRSFRKRLGQAPSSTCLLAPP